MEREATDIKVIKPHRYGTFLILIISIVLILTTSLIVLNFMTSHFARIRLEKEQKQLESDLKTLNELFTNLGDEDYYLVYVREYYYDNEALYK